MKSLKLVILTMLVMALGLAGQALAIQQPPGCSANNLYLDLDKDKTVVHNGETIVYTVEVGNEDATGCDVTDTTVTLTLPDADGNPLGTVVTLDTGADFPADGSGNTIYPTVSYTVSVNPGVTDVVVKAEAHGVLLDSPDVNHSADIVKTVGTTVTWPCIKVGKWPDCDISKEGDEVIYHICIRNCSDPFIPLHDVTVVDDVLGDLSALFPDDLLDGTDVCIDHPYTIKGTDPDPLVNTVTASANDVSGYAVTDINTAKVDLIHPSMTVKKECQTDPVSPGGDADFLITITNTGDCDLEISTDEPEIPDFTLTTAAPVFTKTVTRTDPGGVDEVCNKIEVTWTLDPEKYCAMDNNDTIPAEDCCPIRGEEGCTPGFWKNNADKHDASAWFFEPAAFPGVKFSSVFGVSIKIFTGGNPKKPENYITDPNLLEALGANGGGINALARHAVAALLNAGSKCVDYPMSLEDITAAVKAAVAADGDAIEALHIKLAGYNEAGCPVNQHGDCVGVEPDLDG